jgi:hypothetical protein
MVADRELNAIAQPLDLPVVGSDGPHAEIGTYLHFIFIS